jgi:hypothetical protein
VRQVRGLQGAPWKQEAAHFEAYAAALLRLVGLYTSAADAGQPSIRCIKLFSLIYYLECASCRDAVLAGANVWCCYILFVTLGRTQ